MEENQEKTAISKLQQGDVAGLDTLLQLYQRPALRTAYLICRNAAVAEEVVQSAFVRLCERIRQFDNTRPFGPWFLRTVTNDVLKSMRHTHISLDTDADALVEVSSMSGSELDLLNRIEEAETKAEIWAILDNLSPAQRTTIVMRYYLELSDSEIAATLDIPSGTVRRRLHDAHQNLRRMLTSWAK